MRLSSFRIAAIVAISAWSLGARGEPAAEPAPAPAATPAAAQPANLVFVPYDKMTGPKLGRDSSVLLPYAEFLRLRGATNGNPDAADFRASAAIAQASYAGKVEGSVVEIEAELAIDAMARPKDWLEIPLPFAGAAIASAAIEGSGADGSAATLAPLEGGEGLGLRLRGEGRRTVRLKLAAPLKSAGAARRLEFGIPRAAAATLKLSIPADAALEPAPDALPAAIRAAEGGAEISASCGSRDKIVVVYRAKSEPGGAAAQSRLAVEQATALSVSPKTAYLRSTLAFRPLSGKRGSVEISIPPGVRLLGVAGPFVRDWSVKEEGNIGAARAATVALAQEVGEPFELAIEAQIEGGDSPDRVSAPELRVVGAAKESGTISVTPDPGLDVWPQEMAGLESVSTQEASGAARAFRFAQPGWKLVIARRPVPARVRADGIILYEIADEFVRIASRHRLAISGRGIFGATFAIPEGYELREAGPPDLVSGFRQEGRKAEVNFRGERGEAGAEVELRLQRKRAKEEPKLAIEPIAVEGAEEDAGRLAIAAPAALRVTETKSSGLQAADVREFAERLQPLRSPDLNPALGYRYFTAGFSGEAAIEKQKASVTCDTAEMASATPALIRIDATLNYNVEFTAIDEFRLLVPAAAGENVRFTGEGIKEKIRDALGQVGDDGMTTWTIRLQSRVVGAYALGASFDQPLSEADAGKTIEASVPLVRAIGVTRETGHLAVSRGENLEVRAKEAAGLELRDVKELPRPLAGAFLGYRYFDPKRVSLKLELVRHELEKVLGAVIRRMHTDTVLNDQGEARHEVTFEVQNNREQYLELALPPGMEVWSAFVRGTPVTPTRNEKGALLIELPKSESMSSAFRVRAVLRQAVSAEPLGLFGSLAFAPPAPSIPVLRATWKLYLPTKFRFLRFGGTMRLESGGSRPWIEPAAEALLNDIPASFAAGASDPAMNPPVAREGTAYNAAETDAERQARMGGGALDVPIVRIGQQFEFSKLSGVGGIEASYWKAKPLVIVQGALAILVLLALLILTARLQRISPAFAAAVVALVGASLAEGFAGRMFATALASSTLALGAGAVVAAMRRARAMRNIVLADPERRSSAGYDEDFAYPQSAMPLSPSHPEHGTATAPPKSELETKPESEPEPEAAPHAEAPEPGSEEPEAETPTAAPEQAEEEKPAKKRKRRGSGDGDESSSKG